MHGSCAFHLYVCIVKVGGLQYGRSRTQLLDKTVVGMPHPPNDSILRIRKLYNDSEAADSEIKYTIT